MKSNPYVYPYKPFFDLSKKDLKNNFIQEKKISLAEISDLLNKLENPAPKIFGESPAEKILSIFLDEEFLFGPKEYIWDNKQSWLDQLNFFINQNKKIQFTILGFPFKIPVPLKTDRILPDMGEALSLVRLNLIADNINKIYQPGCLITVFSEGAFAGSVGANPDDAVAYHNFLVKLNNGLGFSENLNIIPLGEMEKTTTNFPDLYKKKVESLKIKFSENDPAYLEKFKGTYEAVYRIVSTKNYDENILMDVYNENLPDTEVSEEVKTAREDIRQRTKNAIFLYHAYLMVRDDLNFIEKSIPHAITLSVSPKPNRLGIIPVHRLCERLPYHSVPVFYPEKNIFFLEYLIDIKRNDNKYEKIYLSEDEEAKPFYYQKI